MLITNKKLITLLRPKKHSLHPAGEILFFMQNFKDRNKFLFIFIDLHLVFNMVNGSSTFRSAESWIPICLPKFNNKGFLYAYVCYIATNICLLLISPDRDKFFELSEAKSIIVEVFLRSFHFVH